MVLYPKIPVESSSFFFESCIANQFKDKASPIPRIASSFLPGDFLYYSNSRISKISIEKLSKKMLSDINFLKQKRFDYLLIGPGSGALADISSTLNTIFLPTHTTLIKATLKFMKIDNIRDYMNTCEKIGKLILKKNKNIDIVLHYDPIHDRALLKHYLVFRTKFLEINNTYSTIINDFLNKEGTIIYFENKQPWPWHFICENVWLQLGGYGGLSFEEYQGVSERLSTIVDKVVWRLSSEKRLKYDSEWGSSKEFGDSIRDFCNNNGYNFYRITSKHIMELSLFSSMLFYNAFKPKLNGFLIENFWAYSATAAQLSRMLPYWIPWPDTISTYKAHSHLKKLLRLDIPKTARIGRFSALGPDILSVEQWNNTFKNIFDRTQFYGAVGDVGFKGLMALKHSFYNLLRVPNFVDYIYKLSMIINSPEKNPITKEEILKTAKKSGLEYSKK
ncbi:MAG: hypothetical protein QXU20_00030 [Candidatus Woesearchaeota archaeon]